MILQLPTQFEELGHITCLEPIQLDVYYVDRKNQVVSYRWDFGLEGFVNLDNWILKGKNLKGLKEKILADAMFDIGHAFFHYEGDPNYTSYHWALTGWLRDRILAEETIHFEGEEEPLIQEKTL